MLYLILGSFIVAFKTTSAPPMGTRFKTKREEQISLEQKKITLLFDSD